MSRRLAIPSCLAAIAATALAAASPVAAQTATAVIVLDGSNSMNARLPGDNAFKHVLAREAIKRALTKIGPGTQLGLAAFGHRRGGDCTDADIVQPPSSDHTGLVTALERFQPKGFSPVALALRNAAKAVPQGSAKTSLILILDDLASCRSDDPCKAAADIKRDNPGISIHVVGLALKPADAQVMACVTRQTEGRLFEAQDAAAASAAIEQAVQLASNPPVPRPEVKAAPKANTKAAATTTSPGTRAQSAQPAPPPSLPGVHLSAHLSEGKPALEQTLTWRILKEGAEPPAVVAEATQAKLSLELPTGRYIAEVKSELVSVRQSFEVISPAALPVPVAMNAAQLSLSVPLSKGGPPSRRALISVAPTATPAKPIWLSRSGAEDLVVPSGSYRVIAEDGLSRTEESVTVAAGARREVELVLGSGRLVVDVAVGQGDPATENIQLLVEADDPDSPTGKREIARAALPRLETTLPAGSYLVTARRGAAEMRERVSIRPGEDTARTIPLATARVRLSTKIPSGLFAGLPIVYRIERIDAAARGIVRSGEGEQVVDLNPGRYRFEARIGPQNAVAAGEAEIRGGTDQRITLDAPAAAIRLKIASREGVGLQGHGFGDVFWQVRNEAGQTVWQTGAVEPMMALAPGRYAVTVEARDKVLERSFDVRAGESRTIELGGS